MIVIPIFQPSQKFRNLLFKIKKKLKKNNIKNKILIINDGTTNEISKAYLNTLKKDKDLIILNHKINLGKGAAIRTALKFGIKKKIKYLIFADGDGQHHPDDIINFIKISIKSNKFHIGVRNFDSNIPFKNKLGNKISAKLITLLFNFKIEDTQNGLRSIPNKYYKMCSKFIQNGFTYETSILLEMIKKYKNDLNFIPIKTIYFKDKNKFLSHFRPITDSLNILFEIFLRFIK